MICSSKKCSGILVAISRTLVLLILDDLLKKLKQKTSKKIKNQVNHPHWPVAQQEKNYLKV